MNRLVARTPILNTLSLVLFIGLFQIFSTQSFAASRDFSKTRSKTVSFLSYNVENLFDSKHDQGKEDYAYLPLAVKRSSDEVQHFCSNMSSGYYKERCFNLDWSEDVFIDKVYNLSRVIKESGNNGSPDFLILQEVENINALKTLVSRGLRGQGYQEVVLIEGPDKRGIDVAIVSKFPLVERAKYHDIDLSPIYDDSSKVKLTRGILEASFNVYGKIITVMSNHWPSQRNPDETRVIAAETLIKAVKNAKGFIVAAGDFNQIDSDRPHAINELMLNPNSNSYFLDLEKVYFGEQRTSFANLFNSGLVVEHRGTHHYGGKWSSLDRFFVLDKQVKENCYSSRNCIRPIWSSYRVVRMPFMLHDETFYDRRSGREVTYYNIPMRYDENSRDGYSDHLPIYMELSVSN